MQEGVAACTSLYVRKYEGMTVEELAPNVLQGTLRKETIIQNICSKCGATLLEKAKLCDQCGAEKEINEFQKLLKNLPPSEYKGIFTIGMGANSGRFVQINYVAGDSNSKDYVEIFWNNLHKGLKSVLEQPFSSFKQ